MDEPIRTLTSAVARGDAAALERFYSAWFDFMLLEARRACGRDEAFCLDMVQDAMMRVIHSIKPMETEAALRTWLRAVVQSCCYDRLRQESRRRKREAIANALNNQSHNTRDEPHEHEARILWLRERLAQLDSQTAQMLSLRFRLGWTLQRIGRALGLKPGAVDGRITRTLAQLRKNAQEDLNE